MFAYSTSLGPSKSLGILYCMSACLSTISLSSQWSHWHETILVKIFHTGSHYPCHDTVTVLQHLSGATSIRSALRPHSKPVLIPTTWRHTMGSINIHALLHGLLHPGILHSYSKPDVNFMLVFLQPLCAMLPYLLDAKLLLPHLPHTKDSRRWIVSSVSASTSHIIRQPGGHSNRAVTHSHQSRYRPLTLLRFYATIISTYVFPMCTRWLAQPTLLSSYSSY